MKKSVISLVVVLILIACGVIGVESYKNMKPLDVSADTLVVENTDTTELMVVDTLEVDSFDFN